MLCASQSQHCIKHVVLQADPEPPDASIAPGSLVPAAPDHSIQQEQLLQHLVEAQVQEGALRQVLQDVRGEQLATCRAVSAQLRRVHALEK